MGRPKSDSFTNLKYYAAKHHLDLSKTGSIVSILLKKYGLGKLGRCEHICDPSNLMVLQLSHQWYVQSGADALMMEIRTNTRGGYRNL